MRVDEQYRRQVALLVRILPFVAAPRMIASDVFFSLRRRVTKPMTSA